VIRTPEMRLMLVVCRHPLLTMLRLKLSIVFLLIVIAYGEVDFVTIDARLPALVVTKHSTT